MRKLFFFSLACLLTYSCNKQERKESSCVFDKNSLKSYLHNYDSTYKYNIKYNYALYIPTKDTCFIVPIKASLNIYDAFLFDKINNKNIYILSKRKRFYTKEQIIQDSSFVEFNPIIWMVVNENGIMRVHKSELDPTVPAPKKTKIKFLPPIK